MIYNGTHHFKPDQCWSGVARSRIYIWQVISSTLLNHQRRLDAFNNPLLQKVHWGLLVDSSFFSLSSFLICCCCLRCIVILWSPWVNIWSLYFCHLLFPCFPWFSGNWNVSTIISRTNKTEFPPFSLSLVLQTQTFCKYNHWNIWIFAPKILFALVWKIV